MNIKIWSYVHNMRGKFHFTSTPLAEMNTSEAYNLLYLMHHDMCNNEVISDMYRNNSRLLPCMVVYFLAIAEL